MDGVSLDGSNALKWSDVANEGNETEKQNINVPRYIHSADKTISITF